MNEIDRIKEPYDRLMKMRDQQCDLARKAVETGAPVFAGVWMPTGEKLYLISEKVYEDLPDSTGR